MCVHVYDDDGENQQPPLSHTPSLPGHCLRSDPDPCRWPERSSSLKPDSRPSQTQDRSLRRRGGRTRGHKTVSRVRLTLLIKPHIFISPGIKSLVFPKHEAKTVTFLSTFRFREVFQTTVTDNTCYHVPPPPLQEHPETTHNIHLFSSLVAF